MKRGVALPAATVRALVALASAALLSAVALAAQRSGPPADTRSTEHDVEVRVTGCVLGSTITETGPMRTAGEAEGKSAKRWRLMLTPDQRKKVRAIGHKQIKVAGVADRRELDLAAEARSRKTGRGGITLRAAAAATASPLVVPPPTPMPRLVVAEITATTDPCR